MKIAIIGATGSVGLKAVEQALDRGHMVTAFVRNTAKLAVKHENLKIIEGDVLDLESVEKVVSGQDAVLCVIGAGRKGTVRSEGTRNVVRAMERTGVRRLICQSSLGVSDSSGNLNFWWRYVMFGLLLRPAYTDHGLQEEIVKRSDLAWTIVRPAAFTDGPHTGEYRHGFSAADKDVTLKISTADVADFLLKQLTDDTYLRKTPGLSY